jgi:hypothetical protein
MSSDVLLEEFEVELRSVALNHVLRFEKQVLESIYPSELTSSSCWNHLPLYNG